MVDQELKFFTASGASERCCRRVILLFTQMPDQTLISQTLFQIDAANVKQKQVIKRQLLINKQTDISKHQQRKCNPTIVFMSF